MPALAEMTEDGPFTWIRPDVLARTEDTGPTILDYVLVAKPVSGWITQSTILRRDDMMPIEADAPFDDTADSTDHRPLRATIVLHTDSRIEELLEAIALLEGELAAKRLELERLLGEENETGRPAVVIDRMIPNPVGADANAESVTLLNTGPGSVDLSGWKLADDDGGHWPLAGDIAPDQERTFVRNGTGMQLGNGGDLVMLINNDGDEVDQIEYASAGSGQIIRRP